MTNPYQSGFTDALASTQAVRTRWWTKCVAIALLSTLPLWLVMGGVQSLSRSMYARLIPQSQAGEFFGFYNMMGKFAAILGPLLMAIVSLATGSNRLAVLSVVILFAAGGLVLLRVKTSPGDRLMNRINHE